MNPLSGVISDAWKLYRAHAGHLLAVAFVIYFAAAVITALLAWALGNFGLFLGILLLLFAGFLLQASLVKAVQDIAQDGRADLSVGQTMASVLPNLGAVAVTSILAGLAIWIGFWLIIVPGLYLITIWAVIMPVLVIEQTGAIAAFGRSQQLVRGNGWNVFGTLVLVFLIMFAAYIVIGLVLVALPVAWRNGLSDVIAGTVVAPFIAVVVTLMYYRLTGGTPNAATGGSATMGGGYGAA
ncbi:MAG: hypothetical protein ACLQFR_30375 [Streptosporangiaceae bacterium]